MIQSEEFSRIKTLIFNSTRQTMQEQGYNFIENVCGDDIYANHSTGQRIVVSRSIVYIRPQDAEEHTAL